MDGGTREGCEVGDVFVAVMEIVGEHTGVGKEDKWAGGDGFRGIPDVGLKEGVSGATELLDAEVVVVDEALEGFLAILHRAHFDTAAHTVEGHRDHGVAGLPANGAVFGIVDYRPNARLGLDEGLIAIVVVLGDEVVDGGILVEVVGGVGFAFGGGTVTNVVVIVGDLVGGGQLIADVVEQRPSLTLFPLASCTMEWGKGWQDKEGPDMPHLQLPSPCLREWLHRTPPIPPSAPLYPQRTPRLVEDPKDLCLHHSRPRYRKPLSEEQNHGVILGQRFVFRWLCPKVTFIFSKHPIPI